MSDKITIKDLSYQRNGICGNGFFQVLFDLRGDGETTYGLIATFETNDDEGEKKETINGTNCRVVEPLDFECHWRGDEIADTLERKLNALKKANKVKRYYELQAFLSSNQDKRKFVKDQIERRKVYDEISGKS